ncbi:MAG: hypothetical protein M0C28_44680 [Candidatus Moduliflexus flocculans]|nr:hypothetical protein [Candidatus Moduliflexus flocculans]
MPELGFDLFKTSEYIRKSMENMGYSVESVAKTGWIAFKQGLLNDVIAFRADMDALPVSETTQVEFASERSRKNACLRS